MNNNDFVKEYTSIFKYNEVLYPSQKNKKLYLKEVKGGFIVIESVIDSKYVNFYFNEKTKTYKKSDLMICAIEKVPAGWEVENE